jgi:hypothetical protein
MFGRQHVKLLCVSRSVRHCEAGSTIFTCWYFPPAEANYGEQAILRSLLRQEKDRYKTGVLLPRNDVPSAVHCAASNLKLTIP